MKRYLWYCDYCKSWGVLEDNQENRSFSLIRSALLNSHVGYKKGRCRVPAIVNDGEFVMVGDAIVMHKLVFNGILMRLAAIPYKQKPTINVDAVLGQPAAK